jgi:hypothetical protein
MEETSTIIHIRISRLSAGMKREVSRTLEGGMNEEILESIKAHGNAFTIIVVHLVKSTFSANIGQKWQQRVFASPNAYIHESEAARAFHLEAREERRKTQIELQTQQRSFLQFLQQLGSTEQWSPQQNEQLNRLMQAVTSFNLAPILQMYTQDQYERVGASDIQEYMDKVCELGHPDLIDLIADSSRVLTDSDIYSLEKFMP